MEGPISFWGYKEQESNLILPEHDNDDELIVILDYSLVFRVTYTRCHTETINSPDDGHMAAQNM